jgi:hypothetical protein
MQDLKEEINKEIEILKNNQFGINSSIFQINLMREVKNIFNENYKSLKKEIEEDNRR